MLIAEAGLIKGERIGLDASTMEANAALRNIVRRDNGEGYREMLERLAGESGVETPTAEDLARLERKRKGKKLSNTDWISKSDPEAKIAKMKDGTTHLAYKPEHAVDLDTGAVVAAELHPADEGDPTTLSKTLAKAEANLEAVDAAPTLENPAECVADKGYHSRAVLRALNDSPWKTRIAAPKQTGFSRWHGDEAARRAVTNNRARLKSGVAREAFKLRAEIVERCFAHNLDRGGMRRTWLRGRENVHKRYLLHVAGHNLSLLMRQLIGAGTPREAVAGGYGGILVCSRPPGPCWWHGGSRNAARRLSPPHSSSGSESRKKPLNQRAAKDRGAIPEAVAAYRQAIDLKPTDAGVYSNLLLCLCGDPGQEEKSLYHVHRGWAEQFEDDHPYIDTGIGVSELDPERALRIGYLSSDLNNHSVAYFLQGVLANHDRRQFHITCYADGQIEDDMTARLRNATNNWRAFAGMNDTVLSTQIREDRIDVLVDLAGHTAENRLTLFSQRAAPVQVTWIGYPATTGLSEGHL